MNVDKQKENQIPGFQNSRKLTKIYPIFIFFQKFFQLWMLKTTKTRPFVLFPRKRQWVGIQVSNTNLLKSLCQVNPLSINYQIYHSLKKAKYFFKNKICFFLLFFGWFRSKVYWRGLKKDTWSLEIFFSPQRAWRRVSADVLIFKKTSLLKCRNYTKASVYETRIGET